MLQKRFNAYFSLTHHLVYVATPKVACTSLKWWFARLVGVDGEITADYDSVESDPDLVIHDALSRLAPEMTEANEAGLNEAFFSPDYLKFCVVRNPFTRAFSGWQSKWLLREPLQSGSYRFADGGHEIQEAPDVRNAFESFLRHIATIENPGLHDPHLAPQASLLEPENIPYSIIAHIENTSNLEEALRRQLGAEYRNPFMISSFVKNASLLPYSSDWISDESARLIHQIYEKDFALFGYELTVPPGMAPLSADAMAISARAIRLIRGRNQRIGALIREKVPWMREEYERTHGAQPHIAPTTTSGNSLRLVKSLGELELIAKHSLDMRDQTLSVQRRQLAQMKTELIRANAQLKLLKEILLDERAGDSL